MASPLSSTTDGPVPSRAMVAPISSETQNAGVPDILSLGIPTVDTVCSWGSDDLYKWLIAMKRAPLGHRKTTIEGFRNADIDGPVCLAATETWLNQQCHLPPGVSKRLCMLGEAIRENIGET